MACQPPVARRQVELQRLPGITSPRRVRPMPQRRDSVVIGRYYKFRVVATFTSTLGSSLVATGESRTAALHSCLGTRREHDDRRSHRGRARASESIHLPPARLMRRRRNGRLCGYTFAPFPPPPPVIYEPVWSNCSPSSGLWTPSRLSPANARTGNGRLCSSSIPRMTWRKDFLQP